MQINPKSKKDLERGVKYFEKLCEGNTPFELVKRQKPKSVSNNAYLHVCINLFAINQGESKEHTKKFLKDRCNFMNGVLGNGKKFVRSCAGLDNKECAEFITWIRNFSSKNLGYYIPTPEEYLLNKYEIDKEINNHKQYL